MYKLEKSDSPLYMQLYTQIKEDIINNVLNANSKLPSIRKMSSDYKISKTTVESAYSQLYAEGYIESHPKSGYFVSKDIVQNFKSIPKKNSNKQIQKDYKYDFYQARLSEDVFPKKIWSKLYNKAVCSINFGLYPNKQGDLALRKQLASYLSKSRAVICDEEQIVICSGFADSMFIISNILKNFSSSIAIEYPGYKVVQEVFSLQNYKITNIPLLKNGIDLEKLKKSKDKLIYVTPSHQYPTGKTIPISKRIELINWACENDAYIIEDDYDSELSYNNRPIPSLQGINNNQRVIYSGTFSKALSPAIRVSYIVLPKKLVNIYKDIFLFSFSGVPLDIQKTLELFIKEGYWDKHIRKMRTLNKKKHDLMKKAIKEYLKDSVQIIREGSGLTILIKACVKIDWDKLYMLLEKNSIKIYSTTYDSSLNDNTIYLGFGCFNENEISIAVKSFSKQWFKAIKNTN
ncbi:GntR family transcriptional regulator [Malaciobacter molluscorum]|uniref:MocR-like pyridoxine biosynthesis transcription factor PdxR n=1 Tax=Malaciobacter molluscorum TaxID=1032072 RepID=UPI00100B0396|nr:PLP-dependent aminotransferase family protein [Malaciobacter molluscorum]RXJ93513.1 GntR family transcriptional regulator [Malaciobacter molluscorum]